MPVIKYSDLCSVTQIQFIEDGTQVIPDGSFTEKQARSNFFVTETVSDQAYASRLPGHPEKDLPYRLQGGTFGEIPFLPLQTTQTEGKYTESTQPGEFRETA